MITKKKKSFFIEKYFQGTDLFTIEAYDPDRVVDNSIAYEITNVTYNGKYNKLEKKITYNCRKL